MVFRRFVVISFSIDLCEIVCAFVCYLFVSVLLAWAATITVAGVAICCVTQWLLWSHKSATIQFERLWPQRQQAVVVAMRKGLHSLHARATCELTDQHYWNVMFIIDGLNTGTQYNQVFYFHKYREKCFVNFILKIWMEWKYNVFGRGQHWLYHEWTWMDAQLIWQTANLSTAWSMLCSSTSTARPNDAAKMRCTNVNMHMVYAHNAQKISECTATGHTSILQLHCMRASQWENCALSISLPVQLMGAQCKRWCICV